MAGREPLEQLAAWQDSVIEEALGINIDQTPVTSQDFTRVTNIIRDATRKRPTTQRVSKASIVPALPPGALEAIEFQASPLTSTLTGIGVGILAGEPEMSVQLDALRDMLDRALPEELLGLEFGGSTAGGKRLYNNVYIEDGKVKYTYPDGRVRTLGYTPSAAKKKYRRKPRRKRWTQRDQKEMEWKAYIASIMAGKVGVPP